MNQNSQNSDVDREKLKAQIKKLLALSKSPFKAEADTARKKANALLKIYNAGKIKVPHPKLTDYEVLLYRAFIEGFGCVWHESYAYGLENVIQSCLEYTKKCMGEIEYGIRECEKSLSANNKNTIGVSFWYNKCFYFGLCEGLNVKPQYINATGLSHLDYGSQLFVCNNSQSHGLGIGRYYVENRRG